MERILVTGATGRLGANLVKKLLDLGYEVRAFVMKGDPDEKKLSGLDCEIFYGNFLEPDTIEKAVIGCDRVLHMGCVMYKPENMPETTYWNLNVTGTFVLARAAARNHVKKYVYASTDATYDATYWMHLPIEETHPQRFTSLYGTHKMCGEQIAWGAMRELGLAATVTRFASIMVADEILNFFTMRYVLAICKNSTQQYSNVNPLKLPNTELPVVEHMSDPMQLCIPRGRDFRSWRFHISDVRDTIDGIILAMKKEEAVGEVFNLGYNRAFTWEEIVKYIAEKSNRPYTDLCLDTFWDFEMDTSKIRNKLGFQPRYGFKEMIDDAFRSRAGEDIGLIQGASYFK